MKEDKEKKQVKTQPSKTPKLLTREDEEMFKNDAYESQFEYKYDDHDRD